MKSNWTVQWLGALFSVCGALMATAQPSGCYCTPPACLAVDVGNGGVAWSPDGTNWSFNETNPPLGGFSISGLAYGGANNFIAIVDGTNIAQSCDGETWTNFFENAMPYSSFEPTWQNLLFATTNNGPFVAISSDGEFAAYSSEGTNWSDSATYFMPSISAPWCGVAYGNGTFVAIAPGTTTSAYSQDDGATWHPSSGLPVAEDWAVVAYGNGVFVAAAWEGDIGAVSSDGVNWDSTSMPYGDWTSLVCGNGVFVAIDFRGNTAYSYDGVDWTSNGNLDLSDLGTTAGVFAGGLFTIFAQSGVAVSSSDGINWTAFSCGGSYQGWLMTTS